MGKFIDLTGKTFGRLTVAGIAGKTKQSQIIWSCNCVCGGVKTVRGSDLKNLRTQSCGCLQKETIRKLSTKHGNATRNGLSAEYQTWHGIKQRCLNPNTTRYNDYGGRGITIEWESFEDFYRSMGPKPSPAHSIERSDVNGNYSTDNCYWGTTIEQSRNQRVRKDSKIGIRGVRWSKQKGKYYAGISIGNDKQKTRGYFDTIEEAEKARKELEEEYWGKSS